MTLLKKTVAACAVALAGLAATSSHAVATIGTIPGGQTNEFIQAIGETQIEGWFGANLYLIAGPGGADLTVSYYGAEAGFQNSFTFGGCNFSHSGSAAPDLGNSINPGGAVVGGPCTSGLSGLLSQLLAYSFSTNSGAGGVVNGFNPENDPGNVNVFIAFEDMNGDFDTDGNGSTASGGQVAWLFLDDAGGFGQQGVPDDDNHDDMIIRIAIANGTFQVPEPTSLALLGAALLGLGAARRRSATKQ